MMVPSSLVSLRDTCWPTFQLLRLPFGIASIIATSPLAMRAGTDQRRELTSAGDHDQSSAASSHFNLFIIINDAHGDQASLSASSRRYPALDGADDSCRKICDFRCSIERD